LDNYDRLASLSASPITKPFLCSSSLILQNIKHSRSIASSGTKSVNCLAATQRNFPKQLHPTPGNRGRQPPWEAKLLPLKTCRIGQGFAATNRATSNYVRVPAVTRCCSVAPVPLRICTACVPRCPKWRQAFCSASAKDHWDAEAD
jgi:hypothetical protein